MENVVYYDVCDSTSIRAAELAKSGACHGTAVIAKSQTAGRGRFERSFFSPPDSGLYLSIILQGSLPPAGVITASAAVLTARAIKRACGRDITIKWVNDLFYNDKKICGILAQAVSGEDGVIGAVILGIGINIYPSDLPEELKTVVGFLYDNPVAVQNELAEDIINSIRAPGGFFGEDVFEEYKTRMFLTGKAVTVIQPDKSYKATVLGIDRDYRLIVTDSDGRTNALSSGEVSVRF